MNFVNGLQSCNQHHHQDTKYFHYPLKPFCIQFSLNTFNSQKSLVVSLFLSSEYHINRILQYVAFCVLSPTIIMLLRFIHAVAFISNLCLRVPSSIPLCRCYCNLCTHSHTGLHENVPFHFSWVNIQEWDYHIWEVCLIL